MRQKIFATGEMAKELQKEAVAIWRKGCNEECLEAVENDPVVSLLMTALAYQEYTAGNELTRLKNEVLDELSNALLPFELCHAKPASVLIQTHTEKQINKVSLNSETPFSLNESKYNFIPLLKTTIYNADVNSIVRLDARRWKVNINFKEEVYNLDGFSFLIDNQDFKDLKISLNGKQLSLIKPWDYAKLPLSDCFSIDSMLYNNSLAYDATNTWFDLFAEQNKRMFVIEESAKDFERPLDNIDLIFEFVGINDDFVFDKSQLKINTVLLVNVNLRSATISVNNPIVRIADESSSERFLHLIRPSLEQMYKNISFTLRRSGVERFNLDGLLKLLHCLIDKYSTDYYAFMQIDNLKNGSELTRLYQWLVDLTKQIEEMNFTSGVYLLLKKGKENLLEDENLGIQYLTTCADKLNTSLNLDSTFSTTVSLSMQKTKVISQPVLGVDESVGMDVQNSLSRYYMVTRDRLVSPADVKIFCYNELLRRYNIDSSIIHKIEVKNTINSEKEVIGFHTTVEIEIIDDVFVKRRLSGRINQVELILQKMIEVRSSTPYPIQVNIRII